MALEGFMRKLLFGVVRRIARTEPQPISILTEVLGDILVPKPAGRVSASLRAAGLRLARLKPVFVSISRGRPEYLSSPSSRIAASCLFQSAAEFANNSVVCHSEEHSDEESDSLSFVIDS